VVGVQLAGRRDAPDSREHLDTADGRIYWANQGGGISYANLEGSGGGDLNTTGASTSSPCGVAIYAGKIYWANGNGSSPTIAYANLNGSGGGNLNTAGASTRNSCGVAIDPVTGRIYWSDGLGDAISYANLDGSGGAVLNTTGASASIPYGVAIDELSGRIYWGDYGNVLRACQMPPGGTRADTTGTSRSAGGPSCRPDMARPGLEPSGRRPRSRHGRQTRY
jgi:DNA-binding beta-propeller fold protein YncE